MLEPISREHSQILRHSERGADAVLKDSSAMQQKCYLMRWRLDVSIWYFFDLHYFSSSCISGRKIEVVQNRSFRISWNGSGRVNARSQIQMDCPNVAVIHPINCRGIDATFDLTKILSNSKRKHVFPTRRGIVSGTFHSNRILFLWSSVGEPSVHRCCIDIIVVLVWILAYPSFI